MSSASTVGWSRRSVEQRCSSSFVAVPDCLVIDPLFATHDLVRIVDTGSRYGLVISGRVARPTKSAPAGSRLPSQIVRAAKTAGVIFAAAVGGDGLR
jgi:hypothetical protein